VGPIQLNFRPMDQSFSYGAGWRRRRSLVHWGRSETIWSKWLNHYQVL